MKRTRDSTRRQWADTQTGSRNGPSMWLLPSGGQFYTRSCTRCARLLPHARSEDLKADSENAERIPCVHCGDLIDATILSNQKLAPDGR